MTTCRLQVLQEVNLVNNDEVKLELTQEFRVLEHVDRLVAVADFLRLSFQEVEVSDDH